MNYHVNKTSVNLSNAKVTSYIYIEYIYRIIELYRYAASFVGGSKLDLIYRTKIKMGPLRTITLSLDSGYYCASSPS